MKLVAFLAAAAVSGTVARVGLGASQAMIRDELGDQCIADQRKKSLRLDYGLLEFNLSADRCESIAVQVHRLAHGAEGMIPPVLSAHIEEFSGRVLFESLRSEIERGGTSALEEIEKQYGYRCYRVAGSHVKIYVVDEVAAEGEPFASGDLWSIMISGAG